MNDLKLPENMPAQITPDIVRQMMGPLVEAMGKLLENNTQALNKLSIAQQVQNDRLEALERQIRLNTPVTRQQVKYLNGAMKERALDLLDKAGATDAKGVRKITAAVRKDTLSSYGITAVDEIPKHEYQVCMNRVMTWNNMRIVREVVKEVRERADMENAEPAAD